jgi:Tol biopolymer transport system component
LTADAAAGRDRRGLLRGGLAAGVALLAIVGSGFAAQAAEATTFPGTNGRIGASGPISTNPLSASGSRLEIFTMRSQYSAGTGTGAGECKLTNNGNSDFNPRFSKDGRKVVFVRDNNLWTLMLNSADKNCVTAIGGTEKQLTGTTSDTASAVDSFVGGWSPPDASGNACIVFTRREAAAGSNPANFEVYRIRVNANREAIGAAKNLSNKHLPVGMNTDSQPAWKPDGTAIAFTSNRGGGKTDIWEQPMDASCNPVGTPTPRTVENTVHEESAPAYSPDGTQIAFQTDRDTATGQPRDLEIYRTDGTSVKKLTNNPPSGGTLATGGALLDLTGYDLFPAWSPDGKRICFHSGRAPETQWRLTASPTILGQWELYTIDAIAGENADSTVHTDEERLTKREFNDERCGWQALP